MLLGFREIICVTYLSPYLTWVKHIKAEWLNCNLINKMGSTFLRELLEKKSSITDFSWVPGTDRFHKWHPLLLSVISSSPYALTSLSHRSFGACISTDITPPTYWRTLCLVSLILWTWLIARWSSHMMMFRWGSPGKNKEDEDTGTSLSF